MGYYINLTDSTFLIPAENLDSAYKALCDLNERDDLKHGGRYGGGKGRTQVWFSWMDPDYPSVCPDAESIFNALGFETSLTDDGALSLDFYDSKAGDEDKFLDAVAPFVEPGSYLSWRGEDGSIWRDIFDGKTRENQYAEITWHTYVSASAGGEGKP